jgi:hypothetical protein
MPGCTLMVSGPMSALASWIAARSVHPPPLVAQTPLPTLLSGRSAVSLTTSGKPAAPAAAGLSAAAADSASVAASATTAGRARLTLPPSGPVRGAQTRW